MYNFTPKFIGCLIKQDKNSSYRLIAGEQCLRNHFLRPNKQILVNSNLPKVIEIRLLNNSSQLEAPCNSNNYLPLLNNLNNHLTMVILMAFSNKCLTNSSSHLEIPSLWLHTNNSKCISKEECSHLQTFHNSNNSNSSTQISNRHNQILNSLILVVMILKMIYSNSSSSCLKLTLNSINNMVAKKVIVSRHSHRINHRTPRKTVLLN